LTRLAVALWLALLLVLPARAEQEVVAALSQNRVSITTTFSGVELFVFGAVKRAPSEAVDAAASDLDVIVAVEGPAEPVLVRRKARTLGIWANAEAVLVQAAPSFYSVASTRPLSQALSATDDLRHRIGIEAQVLARASGADVDAAERNLFREAVIRLRREAGLYQEAADPVELKEGSLFAARFALPANLVEGDYRARVFLLQQGAVIDHYEDVIAVRRAGLERWLHALSREAPLIYGLMSIAVALFAGWGASEIFRLLRR